MIITAQIQVGDQKHVDWVKWHPLAFFNLPIDPYLDLDVLRMHGWDNDIIVWQSYACLIIRHRQEMLYDDLLYQFQINLNVPNPTWKNIARWFLCYFFSWYHLFALMFLYFRIENLRHQGTWYKRDMMSLGIWACAHTRSQHIDREGNADRSPNMFYRVGEPFYTPTRCIVST